MMWTTLLGLVIAAAQSAPVSPAASGAARAPASIAGRVTAQDGGRPLPRIVVTLTRPAPLPQLEAVTDGDGRYEFTGLTAGRYAILAVPDDGRSTYLRQQFGSDGPALAPGVPPRAAIELKSGEARSGVDVALLRAVAIEGRVSDPWDEPMADVEVMVSHSDGRPYPAHPVYSDDRGMYRVYGLAPGRYRVCASPRESSDVPASDRAGLVRTCHPESLAEPSAGEIVLTSQDVFGIDIRVQWNPAGNESLAGAGTRVTLSEGDNRTFELRLIAPPPGR